MSLPPGDEDLHAPGFDVAALEREVAEALAFVGGVTAREGHSIVMHCPPAVDEGDLEARISFHWGTAGAEQGQRLTLSFWGSLPFQAGASWSADAPLWRFRPSPWHRMKDLLWGSLKSEALVHEPLGIPSIDKLKPRGSQVGRLEAASLRTAIARFSPSGGPFGEFDGALVQLTFSLSSLSLWTAELPRSTALTLGEAVHTLWVDAVEHRRLAPGTPPMSHPIPTSIREGLRDLLAEGFTRTDTETPSGASFAAANDGLQVLVEGSADGRTVDVKALGVLPSRDSRVYLERPAKRMWRVLPPIRLGARGIDRRFRIDGDTAGLQEMRAVAPWLEGMADCFQLHVRHGDWGVAAENLDLAQCLRLLRGAAGLHGELTRRRGASTLEETPSGMDRSPT